MGVFNLYCLFNSFYFAKIELLQKFSVFAKHVFPKLAVLLACKQPEPFFFLSNIQQALEIGNKDL